MKRILLCICLLFLGYFSFAQKVNYPLLPNVDIKTIDGKTINTKDLHNDGKPFLISLWATWCKPCIAELEAISLVYSDWMDELGIKVYAISIDDTRTAAKVATFVNSRGWEYTILQDVNSDFKRALNVNDVPFLCIVNGNREIVWTHTSYAPGGEEEVYEVLKNLSLSSEK